MGAGGLLILNSHGLIGGSVSLPCAGTGGSVRYGRFKEGDNRGICCCKVGCTKGSGSTSWSRAGTEALDRPTSVQI